MKIIIFSLLLFISNFCDDRDVLLAIYKATQGDYWNNNTNWGSDAPIAQWYGVTVGSDGSVSVLDLGNNNLNGTLPTEIGSFLNISELYLNSNFITDVPSSLGNLSTLQYLDLSHNLLSTFPSGIYNLVNLLSLSLGYNQINDVLTEKIGGLSQLSVLSLINNSFYGPIPSSIGHLTQLIRLWLGGNAFSELVPPEIQSLTSLKILDISRNKLTGTFPEVDGLVSLQELLIFSNQFVGSLPDSILALPHLTVLAANNNFLTGLPPNIASHPTLFALIIQNNNITGPFPSGFDTTGIVVADLSLNPWQCPIPDYANWTNATCSGKMGSPLPPPSHVVQREKRHLPLPLPPPSSLKRGKEENGGSGDDDNEGRVQVEDYAFSKCPDYIDLEQQFQWLPLDLDDYYDIYLYFFAPSFPAYPSGFMSAHGQTESYGDFATLCAIALTNNNKTLWRNFTACVSFDDEYLNIPERTQECAKEGGFDWEEFKTCIREDGPSLLAEGSKYAQDKKVTWSPTVYMNGEFECEWNSDNCYIPNGNAIRETICGLYSGDLPLPAGCRC